LQRKGRTLAEEHELLEIISGGQTGVDRAALDIALELGLAYGGWCPQGGWAEDLPEPPGLRAFYPDLRETPGADPRQRTEWNVRDCDRLMVLVDRAGVGVSQGTALALACAERLHKPHAVIDLDADDAPARARAFLDQEQGALCIAGPRESEAPGIDAKTRQFLHALLGRN
jgi:pimeloyl-ACP methyl ester carboxylesterase